MSADSPRKISKCYGTVVRPQPVTDKSVVESLYDFVQDVTQGSTKIDDREKVLWMKFEESDINDIYRNPDCNISSNKTAPLLIITGYSNGVQIWNLPGSGEAQEVLSMRQGPVKHLCLLPQPSHGLEKKDEFSEKRPIVALCDASSAGQPYCVVKFVSLRTGEEVHLITFKHSIVDLKANSKVVVIVFSERIAVFNSSNFGQMFTVTTCYPSPCINPNPISLSSRWLAYADRKLIPVHQSGGGMAGDGAQSYAATVFSAAKTIGKSFSLIGERVANLGGSKVAQATTKKEVQERGNTVPGIVTIIDVLQAGDGEVDVHDDSDGKGLVAHFAAHASHPISAMQFDRSGILLLTADKLGHIFHVYQIMAHPCSSSLGAVHHLYTLYRGDTTAIVQDISFSHDSRWVAVSTLRGTTHVFPITPYGGPVTVRTHCSARVVNRASRFQRSAGIEDLDLSSAGRNSPVHVSGSPGSSPGRTDHFRSMSMNHNTRNNHGNPRLPPFPHPTTVHPLVQIKQMLNIPGLGGSGGSTSAACSAKARASGTSQSSGEVLCLAACFARSRGWVAGSPVTREKTEERFLDSLYMMNWNGTLTEHIIEPHPKAGTEKITEDTALEAQQMARAQWSLIRSSTSQELRPALLNINPLLIAHEALTTGRPTCFDLGLRQESRESLSSDHSAKDHHSDVPVEEQWLSQVEIVTHVGPHRRLWMGPQFSFKTYQQGSQGANILTSSSSVLMSNSSELGQGMTAMELGEFDLQSLSLNVQLERSSPMAMPGGRRGQRHMSGERGDAASSPSSTGLVLQAGSYEQSPSILEGFPSWPETSLPVPGASSTGDERLDNLQDRLADAMIEASPKTLHQHRQRSDNRMGSLDSLSTMSSGSGSSSNVRCNHSYDARSSPPHMEHVLVFPSNSGPEDG